MSRRRMRTLYLCSVCWAHFGFVIDLGNKVYAPATSIVLPMTGLQKVAFVNLQRVEAPLSTRNINNVSKRQEPSRDAQKL